MREYITNQVNKFRTERQVTQEEFSQAVGVSRQTIIAIEKGKYTPSVMLSLKIAKYFALPVEDVFSIKYEK